MISDESEHDRSRGFERLDSTSECGYRQVAKIPRSPEEGEVFYIDSRNEHPSYTHYLFRFPSKFHPPVVRWALHTFGERGAAVLDPFTGSGTVQVEALVRGMPSVGIDIDPLACFITRAKTTPLPPDELDRALDGIVSALSPFRRAEEELERLVGTDISVTQFERESRSLSLPAIPNIQHWFRRYVIVDLARVFWAIREAALDKRKARFFRACAAAIVRHVSNADPQPVSALEVTEVQAERNARREIRVFDQFVDKARKEIEGMKSLWNVCNDRHCAASAEVVRGDILQASELLESDGVLRSFPLVVTSPPYCTAVNYSRRHKLEMYWLGFVDNQQEHIALAHSYVGRRRVRLSDWDKCDDFGIKELDQALAKISDHNRTKSRALRHYFWAMSRVFAELRTVVHEGGTFVCAVGDSVSYGIPIATTQFFMELADKHFVLHNHFSYVLRNHYMQYPLRQGTRIKQEHILVFKCR